MGKVHALKAYHGHELIADEGCDGFEPGTDYVDVTGVACPADHDSSEVLSAYLPIGDDVPGVVILRDDTWEHWTGVPPLPRDPFEPHPVLNGRRAGELN